MFDVHFWERKLIEKISWVYATERLKFSSNSFFDLINTEKVSSACEVGNFITFSRLSPVLVVVEEIFFLLEKTIEEDLFEK